MHTLPPNISEVVRIALSEDIGSGDITAELLPDASMVIAAIESREKAVICGIPWANEVFAQIDNTVRIEWSVDEGELIEAGTQLATINGPVRAILSGERTALNFLQALSGTATKTRKLVNLIANSSSSLLDTRKTLPGLRAAQKYAVRVGGGVNHRQGLFDAFLIKENHITASGGINAALAKARKLNPNKTLEIEVQNLEEFSQALTGKPDIIMLDNFSLGLIEQAVALNNGRCKLEASGGIREELLVKIAKTGVDYISVGAITKHCQAIDLSLLVQDHLPT